MANTEIPPETTTISVQNLGSQKTVTDEQYYDTSATNLESTGKSLLKAISQSSTEDSTSVITTPGKTLPVIPTTDLSKNTKQNSDSRKSTLEISNHTTSNKLQATSHTKDNQQTQKSSFTELSVTTVENLNYTSDIIGETSENSEQTASLDNNSTGDETSNTYTPKDSERKTTNTEVNDETERTSQVTTENPTIAIDDDYIIATQQRTVGKIETDTWLYDGNSTDSENESASSDDFIDRGNSPSDQGTSSTGFTTTDKNNKVLTSAASQDQKSTNSYQTADQSERISRTHSYANNEKEQVSLFTLLKASVTEESDVINATAGDITSSENIPTSPGEASSKYFQDEGEFPNFGTSNDFGNLDEVASTSLQDSDEHENFRTTLVEGNVTSSNQSQGQTTSLEISFDLTTADFGTSQTPTTQSEGGFPQEVGPYGGRKKSIDKGTTSVDQCDVDKNMILNHMIMTDHVNKLSEDAYNFYVSTFYICT